MYPIAVTVAVLSCISVLLNLPVFFWHCRNRNLASASLIVWFLIINLFDCINAVIWGRGDIFSSWSGPVLCDIEIKFKVGALLGPAGAVICILRSLCVVMDTDRMVLSPSIARRRCELAIALALCWGAPLYLMAIHYVVQPNRYILVEISGCTAVFDNSWPTIALIYVWTVVFNVANCFYACKLHLAIRSPC